MVEPSYKSYNKNQRRLNQQNGSSEWQGPLFKNTLLKAMTTSPASAFWKSWEWLEEQEQQQQQQQQQQEEEQNKK